MYLGIPTMKVERIAPCRWRARHVGFVTCLSLALVAGCAAPRRVHDESFLRDNLLTSLKRELAGAASLPAARTPPADTDPARLQIRPDIMDELQKTTGPSSYQGLALPMGPDLLGQPQAQIPLDLQRAILVAVNHNLELQFARLEPSVQNTQVVAAEAAFDWTLTGKFDAASNDEPRSQSSNFGTPTGAISDQRELYTGVVGLRRQLTSGGQFTIEGGATQNNVHTDGLLTRPDPQDNVAVTLRLDQPLLRGAGSDTALATVRLARNSERDATHKLRADLIKTVTDVEQSYWQLVKAQWDLLILNRLLERGLEIERQVKGRENRDATQAQIADAVASVERRKAQALQAQTGVRRASDRLKVLLNDPAAPVGSEVLLVAMEQPSDEAISISLADSLVDAIAARPEVQQAILSLDDTSIRLIAADNARLPQLDLRLQMRIQGEQNDFGEAFDDATDRAFVNYLLGLDFERPIGNRRAEAVFRQRTLERSKAYTSLLNTVQQVTGEVKQTMRTMDTQYQLIARNRLARIAAAENMRSLLVEKRLGEQGYTVERLDLQLRREEALAQAEREEIAALADYHTAVAAVYAATGKALERNRIEFDVPPATGLPQNTPSRP